MPTEGSPVSSSMISSTFFPENASSLVDLLQGHQQSPALFLPGLRKGGFAEGQDRSDLYGILRQGARTRETQA